jgi:hypothetical protein
MQTTIGLKVTYVPDTEDDPGRESGLPFGILLDDGLHEGEQLGGLVLDLAVNL